MASDDPSESKSRVSSFARSLEPDDVGVVVDEDRGEARRGLDDAPHRGLRDLRRQAVRDEVELELHLVAEFDEDVAIASGKDSRLRIDHGRRGLGADGRGLNADMVRWRGALRR